MRTAIVFVAALALALPACTGAGSTHVEHPAHDSSALYGRALEAEAVRGGDEAVDASLSLVDAGLASGAVGLPAVLAGLDALAWRDTLGLSRIAPLHALAFRVPGALGRVEARLGELWQRGGGHPLGRAYVAEAIVGLARFRGDAATVAVWRSRTGSVPAVTGIGPFASAPLAGVERVTPVEAAGSPLAASYPGIAPFAAALKPLVLDADDGTIDAGSLSVMQGVSVLVVDVDVPRAQRVHLALRTTGAAVVVVGGKVAFDRPYLLGGAPAVRFGTADVPAGKTRVVVRLGLNDDGGRVALSIVGDDGAPLGTAAPAVGSSAPGVPEHVGPDELPRVSPALDGAALLSVGDARGARRVLDEAAARPDAAPATLLVYARALGRSDDVPETRRMERVRSLYERVLAAWPASSEAVIGNAIYAAGRRGPAEGRVETLRDLAKRRGQGGADDPLVRAFEAATAAEVGMRDVVLSGFDAVTGPLAGTPILAELDDKAHPRTGAEAEAYACTGAMVDRQTLACLGWHQRRGDAKGVYAEIERLRVLRGSKSSLRREEIVQRVADGDVDGALAVFDALPPADRLLAWLGIVPKARAAEVTKRLDPSARDAPGAFAPLERVFGVDRTKELDERGARAVADARKKGGDSGATEVLLHDETWALAPNGLLTLVLHDVRRTSGTTDVDQGASGTYFGITGREVRRTVRRRIHKKDGRVLEPDRAAFASQGNADLSQLEPGDCVEQVIESHALPDRSGQLVVDGPDLLPERTGIKHASVTLSYPKDLPLVRWSHPLMGKAVESDRGAEHVVKWELTDASPRRLEEGVPRMDRDVAVSFGTYRWSDVARLVGDNLRSLADRDPLVAKWAHEAAGEGPPSRAMVERVVAASGKTVRVANGGLLSDAAASVLSGAQQTGARQILELGQGSRTWLIHRAFGEVGIPSEIVLAEREPYSAYPNFPARPGRFEHPLLLAHAPDGDVWIDADVAGPPLPAGRISPELRGRMALRASGDIVPLEVAGMDDARDEVDVRLVVDDRGDAKGTFAIVLRGRPAQGLADALDTVVGTDRREMLRRVVLGWLPWATVNEVTLSSREGAWEISLRADVVIPAYAQGEGATWVLPGLEPLHFVFPRSSTSTLGATYTARGGRKSALAIDSAFQYHVHRRVELPRSAKGAAQLPAVKVARAGLDATRKATLTGNVLDEDFSLSLPTGTVAADAYDAFAGDAKRVDDGFLSGTRIAR